MEKDGCVYTYIYTYVQIHSRRLLNHKRNEIVLFAATQVDLKLIVLSRVSQKEEHLMTSLMCGI